MAENDNVWGFRLDKERFKTAQAIKNVTQAGVCGSNEAFKRACNSGRSKVEIEAWATIMGVGWLDIIRKEDWPKDAYQSPLIFEYRKTPANEKNLREALASKGKVRMVTIYSIRMHESLGSMLDDETQLEVLTWLPRTISEAEGFGLHVKEDTPALIKESLKNWDQFVDKHPKVSVLTYNSSPTLQGMVLIGQWTLVELIPYNTSGVTCPALFFREAESNERDGYELFSERFLSLREASKPRVPGSLPSWL